MRPPIAPKPSISTSLCFIFFFSLLSHSFNSVASALAECQQQWMCSGEGCEEKICLRIPDTACENYASEYSFQPYYTGGYAYIDPNCVEPDLEAPPPLDPLDDEEVQPDPVTPPSCDAEFI